MLAASSMVMKAPPAAVLEVAKPDLLLEFLIIPLDPPAHLGSVHQVLERGARAGWRTSIGWVPPPRVAIRSAAIAPARVRGAGHRGARGARAGR